MNWVEALMAILSAAVGAGALKGWQVSRNISQQEVNEQSVLSFYALWNEELKRLRTEIDTLHLLVSALEQEIITLGGDPVRVRLGVARGQNGN